MAQLFYHIGLPRDLTLRLSLTLAVPLPLALAPSLTLDRPPAERDCARRGVGGHPAAPRQRRAPWVLVRARDNPDPNPNPNPNQASTAGVTA